MTDQQPSSGDSLSSGDPLGGPAPRPSPGIDLGKGGGAAPQWGEQAPAGGGWGEQAPAGPGTAPGGWGPPADQQWAPPATKPPGWGAPPAGSGTGSHTPVGLILGIVSIAVGFFGFFLAGPFIVLLTLPLSIAGWIVSNRELATAPQEGTARAGKIVGIVGVALSILAVVITVLVVGILIAAFSAGSS